MKIAFILAASRRTAAAFLKLQSAPNTFHASPHSWLTAMAVDKET
jgi:hypothetical protein